MKGKEHREVGNIARQDALFPRDLTHPFRPGRFGQLRSQLPIRHHPAGQGGVHRRAIDAISPGQRLGHAQQPGFCRDMAGHAGRPQHGVDRRKFLIVPPFSRISSIAACDAKNVLSRLTAMHARKLSELVASGSWRLCPGVFQLVRR